jgi:hypothetical protein
VSSIADEIFTDLDKSESVSLPEIVYRASRIAKVRIVKRTPVTFLGLMNSNQKISQDLICGHYYHAVVLEAFKGSESEFDFFSAVDADFVGLNRQYLVFAYQRDEEDVLNSFSAIKDTMRASDATKLRCKLYGEYYVPVHPQLLRAFDEEAARMFGGEWLTLPTRDSIDWCEETMDRPAIGNLVTRKKRPDDAHDSLIQWKGLRILIQEARGNWYRFWGSRMGTC